jgi:hypothetical protein
MPFKIQITNIKKDKYNRLQMLKLLNGIFHQGFRGLYVEYDEERNLTLYIERYEQVQEGKKVEIKSLGEVKKVFDFMNLRLGAVEGIEIKGILKRENPPKSHQAFLEEQVDSMVEKLNDAEEVYECFKIQIAAAKNDEDWVELHKRLRIAIETRQQAKDIVARMRLFQPSQSTEKGEDEGFVADGNSSVFSKK